MGKTQLLGAGEACHKKPRIVTVGELLWDLLPDGPRLGGAPANVAFHAARLGADALLISRVGGDESGTRALAALSAAGVNTAHVQVDPQHATGSVLVTLRDGEPSYEIARDVAWDHIDLGPSEEQLVRTADYFCLGSLAARTADQGEGIIALLDRLKLKPRGKRAAIVVDLNLRPPFVDPETLLCLARRADILKLNEDELGWLTRQLGHSPERWLDDGGLELLVVTYGARGAELFAKGVHATRQAEAAIGGDPVGAGDAFLAALCVALGQQAPLPDALARATHHGSLIAGQVGAMPG